MILNQDTPQYSRLMKASILRFLVLLLTSNQCVFAQAQNTILEWEQHWNAYGVGGMCNFMPNMA
jgi:hypothetical protein